MTVFSVGPIGVRQESSYAKTLDSSNMHELAEKVAASLVHCYAKDLCCHLPRALPELRV